MRVLAFDAATETGWASFATARSRPVLGTIKLPTGPDYGARNLALLKASRALIREHRPDVLAAEAPIFMPHDKWHTRRLLTGLFNAIEIAATLEGVRMVEVAPRDAKEALTGDRRADKEAMVAAAKAMGWPVEDDHQADGCAIAVVTYAYLQQRG